MLAAESRGGFGGRMFAYELKKFVSFWLMPFPFCVTAMLAGLLLLRFTRWQRTGKSCLVAGFALLMIAGNHFVSRWLIRPLEKEYPAIPELAPGQPLPTDLAKCEYVVVLGGGNGFSNPAPATSLLSSSALARLVEAVRLLRALPQAKLIVSGPQVVKNLPSHASILAQAAMSLGIARERILFVEDVRDTEDEAKALRRIAGDAPVAVVTSAWHMPRSMALFRSFGVKPIASPCDYRTHDLDGVYFGSFLWDTESLGRSTLAVRERIGYLWISLRGRGSPPS